MGADHGRGDAGHSKACVCGEDEAVDQLGRRERRSPAVPHHRGARIRLAITAGSGTIHDLALGSNHVAWMTAVPAADPPASSKTQQVEKQQDDLTIELAKLNQEMSQRYNQPARKVTDLKKSRLKADQEIIKQKIDELTQQHHIISVSLVDRNISADNKESLREQLYQIESAIEALEVQIGQINNELNLF